MRTNYGRQQRSMPVRGDRDPEGERTSQVK